VFCVVLKDPEWYHANSQQNAFVAFQSEDLDHILLLQNLRLILISQYEAYHVFLQNATAISMMAQHA